MKNFVRYSRLIDLYSGILTEKQFQMLNDFYNNDLSLVEIAENFNISKQAVHYAIKNAENKIEGLESKLKLIDRHDSIESRINDVISFASDKSTKKKDIVNRLENIVNDL